MVSNIVIGAAIRSTVLSINRSQDLIEQTTLRLTTGLRVNSALDQPQNFFTAQSLQNRAGDISALLDGIGQSIRTIEKGIIGVEAIDTLLDQADVIAAKSQEFLQIGETDPAITTRGADENVPTLNERILTSAPDVYYRLNESAGTIVDYGSGAGGPVSATRNGATAGAAPLYANGSPLSVSFDGTDDYIDVVDSNLINLAATAERTVELVFDADTTAGRQILFEEGSTTNGIAIYIDNGVLRITAEDDAGANRFANLNLNVPISADTTYHVAFVFDGPNASFEGFLNGVSFGAITGLDTEGTFPAHSGDIGIGGMNDGAQFHDGESGVATGFNFDGRISDVAIYNRALPDTELLTHASSLIGASTQIINKDFTKVMEQIERLSIDAHYRGINLLAGDTLITNFNEKRTSTLRTNGFDLAERAGGFIDFNFNSIDNIQRIRDKVKALQDDLRDFARNLNTDIGIIRVREVHSRSLINNHTAGADDLTVADQNEEGANLLASQTRLELGQTALSFGVQQSQQILQLF